MQEPINTSFLKFGHTAGPWSAGWTATPEGDPILTVDDPEGITLAIVHGGDADAAVMAAAPEMLALIRAIVDDEWESMDPALEARAQSILDTLR